MGGARASGRAKKRTATASEASTRRTVSVRKKTTKKPQSGKTGGRQGRGAASGTGKHAQRAKNAADSAQRAGQSSPAQTAADGGPLRTLNTRQVAALIGVSDRTVQLWVRAGCPVERGGPGQANRFSDVEVRRWLADHHRTGRPGRPAEDPDAELAAIKLRKERALARKYELQAARLRASMIDRQVVCDGLGRLVQAAREKLLRLPMELAPMLAGQSVGEIRRLIAAQVSTLLADLANPAALLAGAVRGGTAEPQGAEEHEAAAPAAPAENQSFTESPKTSPSAIAKQAGDQPS